MLDISDFIKKYNHSFLVLCTMRAEYGKPWAITRLNIMDIENYLNTGDILELDYFMRDCADLISKISLDLLSNWHSVRVYLDNIEKENRL